MVAGAAGGMYFAGAAEFATLGGNTPFIPIEAGIGAGLGGLIGGLVDGIGALGDAVFNTSNDTTPPKKPGIRDNDLPARGQPNSEDVIDKPNGNSQIRVYGPDGNAVTDYDWDHDHGSGDPHAHDWNWSGPRAVRGPHKPLGPNE